MDEASRRTLRRLAFEQRVAALGTLYHGAPLVSLVPYSAAPDLSAIDIHVSRLAQHAWGLLGSGRVGLMLSGDPGKVPGIAAESNLLGSGRVGLMLSEPDRDTRNPQALPRLSVQGQAAPLEPSHSDYAEARARYLAKFPAAEPNFQLPDFVFVRIIPLSARLVAGFGRIFDLDAEELKSAARLA